MEVTTVDVVTLVATVNTHGVPAERIEREVRATLARLGVELVPCRWAPDPDTIADCADVDRVEVIDLN